MSDKPSLYVVEKKEVVILVVLFVLVTVLSFTLGVRYGESVGRKAAHEQELVAAQHGGDKTEVGGSLGKAHGEDGHAKADEHGAKAADQGEHGAPAHGEHGDGGEHGEKDDGHGGEHKADGQGGHAAEHKAEPAHGSEGQDSHGSAKPHDSHSPEAAAKAPTHGAGTQPSHEQIDKKSDDYLLNALKDAGVEPPGGKAPHGAKLPDAVKEVKRDATKSRVHSGSFVIQVGSHPTRDLADAQVVKLKARRVQAEVLPAFKDHQGEWHRVVIGSYKSKRDADREAGGLKGKGAIASYFVWRLP